MSNTLFNKKQYKVKLVGRNLEDLRPLLRMFPVEIVDSEPDLVISYGGDGSLLGAERDFPGVPKCPDSEYIVKIHAQRTWLCPLHPKRVLTAAPIGCRQLCPHFSLS